LGQTLDTFNQSGFLRPIIGRSQR